MKYFVKTFLCVLSLFIFSDDVFAVCDNDELNDWAEEVNIVFEQQYAYDEYTDEDGTVIPAYEPEFSYILHLYPERDDLKVYVTDNLSGKKTEVEFSDMYGTYSVGSYVHFKTKKYTFDIYSADDSKTCPGEKLRTIKYSVPSYNMYSQTIYCSENSNEDICASYTDLEVNKDEFYEKVDELENEKNKTFIDKALEIVKEYWYFVVIPLLVVSIFYFIKIWKFKKKENEDLKDEDDDDEIQKDQNKKSDKSVEVRGNEK